MVVLQIWFIECRNGDTDSHGFPTTARANQRVADFPHIGTNGVQFRFNGFHARFQFSDFAFQAGHQ
jgi:hypothetical protein